MVLRSVYENKSLTNIKKKNLASALSFVLIRSRNICEWLLLGLDIVSLNLFVSILLNYEESSGIRESGV